MVSLRRIGPILALAAAVLLAGCGGGGGSEGDDDRRRPRAAATGRPALDPAKTYTVTLKTNKGTFSFDLDVKDSPKTTASFASLVRKGFFDGLTFHRIVPGFVIQGGDPKGDGTGGPGYTTVDTPPADTTYTKGVVAMAKTERRAAGHLGQPVLRRHRRRRRASRPTTRCSARYRAASARSRRSASSATRPRSCRPSGS